MSQATISQFVSYESTTNTVHEIIRSVSKTKLAETVTEQFESKVVVLRVQPNIIVPKNFSSIDDFAAELINEDPSFAEHLASARKSIATEFFSDGNPLKAIRLNAGLSQKDLAKMIGTSQPHIARIEKNPSCMMFETAYKLSIALKIDISDMAKIAGLSEHAPEITL